MSHSVLEEVQCPICIETLKKPIRMLSCGHNLCHSCLEGLCSSLCARCPTCREYTLIGIGGIEALPRNHVVENVIDRLSTDLNLQPKRNFTQVSSHSVTVSYKAIQEFRGVATTYMQNHKFKEAIDILQTLLRETEGFHKIPIAAKKSICYLQTGKIKNAISVCAEIITIIESTEYDENMQSICQECCNEITKVAEISIQYSLFDMTTALIKCLFKMILISYEDEDKLIQLGLLGSLVHNLAAELNSQNEIEKLKPLLAFMECILLKMQKITNVDINTKCLKVSWFLKYYGYCCNIVKENIKSVIIHEQAICLMKTVFGEDANKYRVFGYCYHNLASAFKNLNQIENYNAALAKAIDVYNTATDWVSENEKRENMLLATSNVT